ncbi:MAG: tRNA (N6-isopentenyl adenosine(37)-C2)-methylthiotransferase MiaB [Candidatus Rokuibacteriota bacterium]|nr:MAG: tRNA (N6-isopentenyl adenosine(37)-C2)-methylthiotransferase MiaB [Candidatus Rokubacteria bacterium]PYM72471.1 MAG: tRNA (N6-isopentenyl adenosine(37)-C2)-methylthiotransferase MiaB [Candidatus Rokubacteria bacterium]
MPKLHLITYGCQMNEYDSERVAGLLRDERYELTETAQDADLILLNTCAIREKCEDKVFSRLGELKHLKRERPHVLIGVMGCMAQLWQGKIQERAPSVDLVFGSAAVSRVGELVARARATGAPVLETGEAPLVKITARPEAVGQLKAFVTVMEGCEKGCTFCVVPVTRGRERSHSPASIVAEVRELAAAGVREVTLLGQTVNAYGRDLTPATDLAALLELVDEVEGIERIRFTTSNPYNLTPRLIRAIRDVPKVVEYLHLPLQSGSDRVLGRMHRGYTRARYLELIAELEETVPGIALSTDLIVGFPGEEEADFEQTVDMVERVGYDNVFVFRYSRRPGTPAATMLDQVPEEIKARRNSRLLEVATRVGAARSRALEGRVLPILVDGVSRKNPDEATGRTRCNRVVNFDAHGRRLLGEVVPVLITQALPHSLRGELAGAGAEGRVLATAAV